MNYIICIITLLYTRVVQYFLRIKHCSHCAAAIAINRCDDFSCKKTKTINTRINGQLSNVGNAQAT